MEYLLGLCSPIFRVLTTLKESRFEWEFVICGLSKMLHFNERILAVELGEEWRTNFSRVIISSPCLFNGIKGFKLFVFLVHSLTQFDEDEMT